MDSRTKHRTERRQRRATTTSGPATVARQRLSTRLSLSLMVRKRFLIGGHCVPHLYEPVIYKIKRRENPYKQTISHQIYTSTNLFIHQNRSHQASLCLPFLCNFLVKGLLAMEEMLGLLRIRVKKGTNLAVRDTSSSDPFVVITMGPQACFSVLCVLFPFLFPF